jgi:hypothetical protein
MAATTDKRKSLNRLSLLFTRPGSKSSSTTPTDPAARQERVSQFGDMNINSPSWPLPEEPQPATFQPLSPGAIPASPQPGLQANIAQTRQRSASSSQAQLHHHHNSRTSGQSTLSNFSSQSVSDLQRLKPAQPSLRSRKSAGNLRSPPPYQSAMPQLHKPQPSLPKNAAPAVPNTKVDASLNYMTPATAKDPTLKKKTKSGLFGGKSSKHADKITGPSAWIVGQPQQVPYDVALLAGGAKVSSYQIHRR